MPSNTPQRPTVRDAFFRLLRGLQIDTIFGNPGSTELPMFRDFPSELRYVLGLQESVVVGMADGYAQATGHAALVNLHSAVGVGHAMGNIFTAFKNQTPLIVTAGQQARSILPFDPFLSSAQATHLPQPYVKWACEPARAQDVPLALARAYYTAMQAPRGPVFLSIPADDWDQPADYVESRQVSGSTAPDPAMLGQVAQALNSAQRPAIVAGAGVDRDAAMALLVQLAERHSAAVFTAPMSARCAFPEQHRLFGGFLPAKREGIVAQLEGYDLVLVLGAPAFLYHVEGAGPHLPAAALLWQIVDDPQMAAWTPSGNSLVASLHWALEALLQLASPAPRNLPPAMLRAEPVAASHPISDAYALQVLSALRQAGDVVVEEAPGSRRVMQTHLPMAGAESFYTMASGGLGYGMPAAVGLALGRQSKGLAGRTIALIGDGSSMYSIQALFTAVQLALPITFVILNNRRYAALQDFAPVFGYAPHQQPVGTELPGLDFVLLARAQGMPATRLEHAAQLEAGLLAALSAAGPCLVELVVA